jgi:Tfp pilus assembly protein PilN
MKSKTLRKPARQSLCFPGEEARENWLFDEKELTWKRSEPVSGGLMGVEAMAFDSAPFWCLGQEQVPEDAVSLRWEAQGVANTGNASLWVYWTVASEHNRALAGTLALSDEALNFEGWSNHPETFEPSVCMLPLPKDGMAVWRELGRCVVAFTREGRLLHAAVLASRVLDADAAFELRDVCAALQAHDFLDAVPTIHIWTACETDFVPQLACLFVEAGVVKEPRPDPRPPLVAGGLLPVQVAMKRQERQARQHKLMLLAVAAMMYICFFGAWWVRLQWRDAHLSRAEAELATYQPEMDQVTHAQAYWQAMEGAINPDLYPMELFQQIVSLLPDEGIRLKEFQIDRGKIIVSGEAATVNHALGFKDRLSANAALQHHEWNFPVPTIREDNRADFRAEGTIHAGGTVNEGQ